jgi:hypothetical protein
MKRANRGSLGGLTFRRRGRSDSRQPVEQNGQAESLSDPQESCDLPDSLAIFNSPQARLFSLYLSVFRSMGPLEPDFFRS